MLSVSPFFIFFYFFYPLKVLKATQRLSVTDDCDLSLWGNTGPVRTAASLRSINPKASFDLVVAAYSLGAVSYTHLTLPTILLV